MQLNPLSILLVLFYFISNGVLGQEKIRTKDGAQINGIKQYLEIDAKDASKPILLFLHGGPGFSSRTYFNPIKKGLQDEFIVVQWDQRGTGITELWNAAPKPISAAQMIADTEEVVDYLLDRFDREKLYLVGFSWGGYLGLQYAGNHPEKIHAYISVSGMISNFESEQLTLAFLLKQAQENENQEALGELSSIKIPFENWEQLYFQRKWTAYFQGTKNIAKAYPKELFGNWAPIWFGLFLEASSVNFIETRPSLTCPVYIMASKKDLVSHHSIAEKFFNTVEAPQKELIWFEESTHEIPSQEPDRFIEELVRIGDIKN